MYMQLRNSSYSVVIEELSECYVVKDIWKRQNLPELTLFLLG